MTKTKEKYLTEIQEKQLRIVKHYGPDNQLKQLIEECGELIVVIAKFQRGGGQYLSIKKSAATKELDNLISEIADVENLIEQIKLDYCLLSEGVEAMKEYKVNREIERIRKRTTDTWKLAVD